MSARPLSLAAYARLAGLGLPAVRAFLRRRAAAGKEDAGRLGERLGEAGLPRPAGRLVWVHAASVGETTTALPLVRRFAEAGISVLLTTVTVTSAAMAADRLPSGAVHQFAPVDVPACLARFLDHWGPDLAVFVEQELWPNTIEALASRSVPAALVNARLSERSARGWARYAPGLARHLLGGFAVVVPQGRGDAERLRALGAERVLPPADLKLDVPPPAADPALLAKLEAALAGRPAWAAASTHEGDEALALDVHAALLQSRGDGVLILAPRHPPRAEAVEALVVARNLRCARRSRGQWPDAATDVFLVDTIGEMGLVYAASRAVLMGKTMLPPGGGQNPIEPARFGKPVLHGPYVHNFVDVTAALDAAGGAFEVRDAHGLTAALADFWDDPTAAAAAGARGRAVVEALGGGLDRTWAALVSLLGQDSRA